MAKNASMSLTALHQIIVNSFPQTGVALIFGYGSKVIKQSGEQSDKDLVDIIIAVDNPFQWHQENFTRNYQHYSFLKYFPNRVNVITGLQENFGAKIFFNPYVKLGNISMKYGIIKTDHLIEDLTQWNNIYVAGRLHKPVEPIVDTFDRNEPLRTAMRFNKLSAIRTALLLLPETFDHVKLYKTIASISYNGDIRMLFGEDKNKIDNIVCGQINKFDQLYLPYLNQHFKDSIHWNEHKHTFTQDSSSEVVQRNLNRLPVYVRHEICKKHAPVARTMETGIVFVSLSKSINIAEILASALASIVSRSSFSQSAKGILTAGFTNSLKYSHRKLVKSLRSRLS